MIVATAGHIDHGKTLLVRALTGVDTDRLPEEKRREMTIDLGFAYLPLAGDRSIAFVDVPGHERFIRNMLCGVAGIDFVLLVVAADDGIMPQTREHLAILDLLGVAAGAVAVTKTDRVDEGRVRAVTAEAANLLAATGLARAPIFPVSAATGAGIGALGAHLAAAAAAWSPPPARGAFRLAVDRCFHIVGAGIVATGTVFAGRAAAGDELVLQSDGARLRVRGLHADNRAAAEARPGQRCALNIAGQGVTRTIAARGDWIVAPGGSGPVSRLDARLRVLASERRALAHWTPVHVHLAAAETTGRIALLEGRELAPGGRGLAQLRLDRPLGACHGDRFILRDQSARRTIGGGHVIDIHPPWRGRARPARLAALAAMDTPDPARALAALLAALAEGVDLAAFRRARNLTGAEAEAVFAAVPHRRVGVREGARAFAPAHWRRWREAALANLAAWHRTSPASPGLPEERLLAGSGLRAAAGLGPALARELAAEGAVARHGSLVRLPDHDAAPASGDAALWPRIETLLERAGRVPPTVHELAAALEVDARRIERLLLSSARRRDLARVGSNRFFRRADLRDLAAVAERLAAESPTGRFGVREFRDRARIGRNLAIDLLEHFDAVKLTRRIGDGREIVRPLAEVFGSGQDGGDGTARGRESHPGGAPGLQIR